MLLGICDCAARAAGEGHICGGYGLSGKLQDSSRMKQPKPYNSKTLTCEGRMLRTLRADFDPRGVYLRWIRPLEMGKPTEWVRRQGAQWKTSIRLRGTISFPTPFAAHTWPKSTSHHRHSVNYGFWYLGTWDSASTPPAIERPTPPSEHHSST